MRQQIYTLPAALREDGKEEEEDEDVEEEEKEAPVGSIRRRRKGSLGEQNKNLNMVSASAHVLGGDSCFRTVFMLLAAMVSSVTGISVLRYLRCLWSHRRLDGDCDDHHHRHERCGRSCHVLLRTL